MNVLAPWGRARILEWGSSRTVAEQSKALHTELDFEGQRQVGPLPLRCPAQDTWMVSFDVGSVHFVELY